jgi:superfamily II DNA/RNA helicase
MNSEKQHIDSILLKIGFKKLNNLQKETLEKSKVSNDMFILSQTGSGKTLVFQLPISLNLKTEFQIIGIFRK